MGPRKQPHPLELFRATEAGFSQATSRPQDRRTVPGKVLTTTARPAAGASKVSKPSSRGPAPAGRRLLYTTLGIVGLLVVFVYAADVLTEGSRARRVPVLKRSGPVPGQPVVAAEWFGILAATYPGTEIGEARALDAETGLKMRGFGEGVQVLGFPDPDQPGAFKHYALMVGHVRQQIQLKETLEALRRIDDWQTGKARPFADARIVKHPLSD